MFIRRPLSSSSSLFLLFSRSQSRFFAGRSGFEEREDALEKKAVADHDEILLKNLRKKAGIDGGNGSAAGSVGLKNITVLGAGLMGSGIAQTAATAGFEVILVDLNNAQLKNGMAMMEANLARVSKKKFGDDTAAAKDFVTKALGRIHSSTSVVDAVKHADLVVEAIAENLSAKQSLLKVVSEAAPNWTVFASNTSSLRIQDIGKSMTDRTRFAGMHFFNPVPVMKLVELVVTSDTSDKAYKTLVHFGEKMEKKVVVCRDTPGFIVNRLLVPYIAEAIRMLERNDASLTDIDNAMQLGASYPMGPFTLADYVGLDTLLSILQGWQGSYPDVQNFAVPNLLKELVDKGAYGIKTKMGFFVEGKPNPAFFDKAGKLKFNR